MAWERGAEYPAVGEPLEVRTYAVKQKLRQAAIWHDILGSESLLVVW